MNVAKHAGVNQVTVTMERTAGPAVQITVSDRGTGFGTAARGEARGSHTGSGLWNVKRRLDMIGGRIEVESAPGTGTTVRLSVPLGLGVPTRKSNSPHGHDGLNGVG
jgi:signal transduction histidine kinase